MVMHELSILVFAPIFHSTIPGDKVFCKVATMETKVTEFWLSCGCGIHDKGQFFEISSEGDMSGFSPFIVGFDLTKTWARWRLCIIKQMAQSFWTTKNFFDVPVLSTRFAFFAIGWKQAAWHWTA